MANQWFRMYAGVLEDPKVQRLHPTLFKVWVNTLCVACRLEQPTLPPVGDLAFLLRMPEDETAAALDALVAANLLDRTEQGLEPHNWRARQYRSDVSTERVKRFRAEGVKRYRNGGAAVSETPPDTDTDTDTDKECAPQGAPAPVPVAGSFTLESPAAKPKKQKSAGAVVEPYSPEFESFWAAYPRHDGKREAFDKYRPAVKLLGPGAHDRLREAAARYRSRSAGSEFVLYAKTWLHNQRWEDEGPPVVANLTGKNAFGVGG